MLRPSDPHRGHLAGSGGDRSHRLSRSTLEASLVPARAASAAIAKTKVRVRLMIVLLLPGN
jgi:hypothetical protein